VNELPLDLLLKVESAPKEVTAVENIRKFKKLFPKYMEELLDGIGVSCLTEDIQNPLLWAHYAGNYSGICVELIAPPRRDNLFSNCMQVHYTDKRPVIYATQTGAIGTVYKDHDWSYIAQFGMCTKSSAWAVEREWRVWAPHRAGTYLELPPNTVRAIFLGPLAATGTVATLTNLVRTSRQPVKLFRTKLSDDAYHVVIEKRIL
jgi:hypothetical protein